MNVVKRKLRRRSDEEKRRICETFRGWGDSKASFCRDREIQPAVLNKWLYEFGMGDLVGQSPEWMTRKKTESSTATAPQPPQPKKAVAQPAPSKPAPSKPALAAPPVKIEEIPDANIEKPAPSESSTVEESIEKALFQMEKLEDLLKEKEPEYALELHFGGADLYFPELPSAGWLAELLGVSR